MPTENNPRRRSQSLAWITRVRSTLDSSYSPNIAKKQGTTSSSLPRSSLDNAPPPRLPPPQPSNSAQRSLSRTRSILKFLTPKIRLTIPVPLPASPTSLGANKTRAPTPLDTHSAKEKRDAALRDRGLLPPRQNKDLSRQELEEDIHLPIASPINDSPVSISSPNGIEIVSQADLVKMEWEAKNHSGEDDDFKSFKFSPSSPLHESQESEAPRSSLQDMACPFESQIQDESGLSLSAGGLQNSRDLGRLSPALISLPPSPSPSPTPPASPKLETNLKLVSTNAIDLCSPALVPLPPPPIESTAKHGQDETNLELVLPIPATSATPIISLSPVTENLEPKENDAQGHQRKDSVSDSQSSSLATPSLETSSHTTAMSILGTADSSPKIKTTTVMGGKNIPVIVESPIDSGPGLAIPNTIPEADVETQQETKAHRNKRMQLFGQDPSKRLKVSASLTNMRRSVANTLSRTRSNINAMRTKQDNAPNASQFTLPPSPTFPLNGITERRSLEATMTSTIRQPVAPTLHSRGSILVETNAIEDDEARRMTELAFLV